MPGFHTVTFGEERGVLGVVARDADDAETLSAEAVLQRGELRREHAARRAPRSPEVDDDDAAAMLREVERLRGGRACAERRPDDGSAKPQGSNVPYHRWRAGYVTRRRN
jgi:hypothetical protein